MHCTGGYRVEGKVNGVSVLFLVDSGASVTLIRKDVGERVNTLQQELSGWTGPSLIGVDGTPLQVCGQTKISLTLMKRCFQVEVLIVDSLTTEAILGVSFLELNNILIDLGSKQLLFKGDNSSISMQGFDDSESSPYPSVRVVETVQIPPRSELMIIAETVNSTDGVSYLAENEGRNPAISIGGESSGEA